MCVHTLCCLLRRPGCSPPAPSSSIQSSCPTAAWTPHPPCTKNNFYTRGEDRLIVLGLKDFSQTELPYQLMCRYLIRTKQDQLRSCVKELCGHKASDNAIKLYCQHNIVPAM